MKYTVRFTSALFGFLLGSSVYFASPLSGIRLPFKSTLNADEDLAVLVIISK